MSAIGLASRLAADHGAVRGRRVEPGRLDLPEAGMDWGVLRSFLPLREPVLPFAPRARDVDQATVMRRVAHIINENSV